MDQYGKNKKGTYVMVLMNGDIEVLQFDLEDQYICVLNNDMLPYSLKDYIKATDYSTIEQIKHSNKFFNVFRDYLASRTISLNRENAKNILYSSSLPQSINTEQRLKVALACYGLSMTDNIWIKDDNSEMRFQDVNLRKHFLKDAAYPIAILGHNISVQIDILQPELSTDGMFSKTWYRGEDGISLWKTDKTSNNINTQKELEASVLLEHTNVKHVVYTAIHKDNLLIASCPCLANDEVSIINYFQLMDYATHTGKDMQEILSPFEEDLAKMCVIDYILANTDRHFGNIHFLVSNKDNSIIGLAPLMDFNQSLIADMIGTNIDDLIYEFSGKGMKESALEMFDKAKLEIDLNYFPSQCKNRFLAILQSEKS